MTGNIHRSPPAVIASGRAVAAAVSAVVPAFMIAVVPAFMIGLAAVTSGCETCQPSSRYHKRAFKHELETRLCAPGSFYRECGPGAANPVPGAPAHLSYESCRDFVMLLMSHCADAETSPGHEGLAPREAWLTCLWDMFQYQSIMLGVAGTPVRTDGRCGDPLAWDEYPAHRREAELRERRGQ